MISLRGAWSAFSTALAGAGLGLCVLAGFASLGAAEPEDPGTSAFLFGMAVLLTLLVLLLASWRVVVDVDTVTERMAFVRLRGIPRTSITAVRLVEGDVGWIRLPVTDIVLTDEVRDFRLWTQRRYWLADRQLLKSQQRADLIASLLNVDMCDDVIPWDDPRRNPAAE